MVNFEDEGAVTAKIIDLGLAKVVNEPGSQTAISNGGFCRHTGVRQSRSSLQESARHPFGSLLARGGTLGDGDRPCSCSGAHLLR
jgi:hypothetical protein